MTNRPDAVAALLATFGDPACLPAPDASRASAAECLRALRAAGDSILPRLRALLDGPPLPVIDLPSGRGAVGAKLLALELLDERGEAQDATRYERLAEAELEPLAVRLAAARLWFDSDPADTTPELVDLLVRAFPIDAVTAPRIVATFGDVLATIVPPLVGHLYHRLRNHRLQARRLLVAVGQPAVPRLREVVATTEDEFARADAAAVLEELAAVEAAADASPI